MTFSASKRSLLRDKKNKCGLTFLFALITATAFILPVIIRNGGYFLYYADLNIKQISLYKLCHDAILGGNVGFSFAGGLGTDFIGTYGPFILNPFFLLTLLFPSSLLSYLTGPILILKFGFAALTAHLYIRRFTHRENSAICGGLLYAFSSFSLLSIYFNYLTNAIIVFPLLLLAFEMLITERKKFYFALSVFLLSLTDCYSLFGILVFVIIYYVIRITSRAVKFKISILFTALLESVVGVLLAAVLLVPVFYTACLGKGGISFLNGWSAAVYENSQMYGNIISAFFFPPELIGKPVFFPSAQNGFSSLAGWLPLFSFSGVIAYCSQNKGSWIKKTICTFAFFAFIPFLNSIFGMFGTSYTAGWLYMPMLIICLATASSAEDKEISFKTGYLTTLLVTLFIALLIGLMPNVSDDSVILGLYSNAGTDFGYLTAFLLICGFAAVSLAVFGLILIVRKRSVKAFLRLSVIGIMVVSAACSNVYISYGIKENSEEITALKSALSEPYIDFEDSENNYRTDFYGYSTDISAYLNKPSLNTDVPFLNENLKDFFTAVGVDTGVSPTTDKWSLRSLLSVRYLLNGKYAEKFEENALIGTRMPGFYYAYSSDVYDIYENTNFIPYGFSYEYCISKSDFMNKFDIDKRADILLKAIVLEDEDYKELSKYFKALTELENVEVTDTKSEEDENKEEIKENEMTLDTDYESLIQNIEKLKLTSADEFYKDSYSVKCKVNRDSDTLVFLSVPYTDAFSAKVNGKPAKTYKTNIGFTAVKVTSGESEIELSYRTPGLALGINMSIFGIAVFLIYLVIVLVTKKKRQIDNIYPEGEALIKKWCREELDEESKDEEEESILDDLPEDFFESDDFIDNFPDGFKINTDIDEET